jgi:endonuclease/exonuclease/phosphatase family metal-dependent hydrolase
MTDLPEPHAPRAADATTDVQRPWRIVTWNLHGSALPDLAAIAAVLAEFDPDVVLAQELRRTQARRIATTLGWSHHWARKHSPYTPLLWWRAEGLAVFSRHPITDPRRRSLTPGVSSWTYRHRIALAATVHRDGVALRVHDLHLASGRAVDERIEQARRAVDGILGEAASLVVAGGDLNAPGEAEVIREFHRAGLRDPGGGPTNPAIAPRQRLDYVLVPETSRVVEQSQATGGARWASLSDHVPVAVTFVDVRSVPSTGAAPSR